MADKNIDRLMQVTSFKSWVVLGIIAALIAGVIVWSVVGTLPERIEGKGKLQTQAGTQEISAPGQGVLEKLLIKEGDSVHVGQVVASVRAVIYDAEVQAAVQVLRQRELDFEVFAASEQRSIGQLQADRKRQQDVVRQKEEILRQQQDNFARNAVTRSVVESAQLEVDIARDQVRGTDAQIASKYSAITQRRGQIDMERKNLDTRVQVQKEVSEVTSTVAGRVTQIRKQPGATVFRGQSIASVDSSVGGVALEVVAFVPARNGKRVLPGQTARLRVAGVAPEEFGYLLGEVKSIEQYPVSADVAKKALGEESVTEASYRVRITPLVQAPNRYVWRGGTGADDRVASNTPVDVSIQVSEQRPYSLVLPLDKKDRVPVAERRAEVKPGSSN